MNTEYQVTSSPEKVECLETNTVMFCTFYLKVR